MMSEIVTVKDTRKTLSMNEVEVCDLVANEYELVYAENEEIGLVRKDKMDEYNKLVTVISR